MQKPVIDESSNSITLHTAWSIINGSALPNTTILETGIDGSDIGEPESSETVTSTIAVRDMEINAYGRIGVIQRAAERVMAIIPKPQHTQDSMLQSRCRMPVSGTLGRRRRKSGFGAPSASVKPTWSAIGKVRYHRWHFEPDQPQSRPRSRDKIS